MRTYDQQEIPEVSPQHKAFVDLFSTSCRLTHETRVAKKCRRKHAPYGNLTDKIYTLVTRLIVDNTNVFRSHNRVQRIPGVDTEILKITL